MKKRRSSSYYLWKEKQENLSKKRAEFWKRNRHLHNATGPSPESAKKGGETRRKKPSVTLPRIGKGERNDD